MEGNNTSKQLGQLGEQQPPVEGAGSLPTPATTSQEDFGLGMSGAIVGLSIDEPTVDSSTPFVEMPTLGFTSYSDLPQITADISVDNPALGAQVPGKVMDLVGTTPNLLIDPKHHYNQMRPIKAIRGTNHLIPFGAIDFRRLATDAKTSLTTITMKMGKLSTSIATPGNIREIQNWKRIEDLKDTVISWFNRSIPFTDLETPQRFAIEYTYSAQLAALSMPLFAFAAAGGYIRFLNKHGMQFYNQQITGLYDVALQGKLSELYATIKNFPVVDEMMMERMQAFCRLHTTSEQSGLWAAVIAQDVIVDDSWIPGGPLGTIKLSTGYAYQHPGAVMDYSNNQMNSFLWWLDTFLSNGSSSAVAGILDAFIGRASYLRTNYSVLLGAQKQLAQKGAVKYKYLGEFLPITKIDPLHLEWVFAEPAFSFTFKERFEYAPSSATQETASGSNVPVIASITAARDYKSEVGIDSWQVIRPVGPHHGDSAWELSEISEIGVFKTMDFEKEGDFPMLPWPSQTNGATRIAAGVQELYRWVDSLYGDVYWDRMFIYGGSSAAVVAGTMIVGYYGVTGPMDDLRFVLNYGALELGQSPAPCLMVIQDAADNSEPVKNFSYAVQLAYLANQLDLTRLTVYRALEVGSVDYPLNVDVGYKQSTWATLNIKLFDNTFAGAIERMAVATLKKNTRSQD